MGKGLVTMEALPAHLLVIAVEASGTRDIVKMAKRACWRMKDPQALAEGIRQILVDVEGVRFECWRKTNYNILENEHRFAERINRLIWSTKTITRPWA